MTIGVRPAVSLRDDHAGTLLHPGRRGEVVRRHDFVQLQRLEPGGRWQTVARARLNAKSSAIFRATTPPTRRSTVRVAMSVNQAGPATWPASAARSPTTGAETPAARVRAPGRCEPLRSHDRPAGVRSHRPGVPGDPYPRLAALREATPLFYEEALDRWFVTRHAEVRACLRDRRLGRNFRHVGSEDEFAAAEPLDPRRQAFWDTERWSLLWLEPPEHTRIRKLVAAAFTPRSVEALREPVARAGARAAARRRASTCCATTRSRTRSPSSAACSASRPTAPATCSTGRTRW